MSDWCPRFNVAILMLSISTGAFSNSPKSTNPIDVNSCALHFQDIIQAIQLQLDEALGTNKKLKEVIGKKNEKMRELRRQLSEAHIKIEKAKIDSRTGLIKADYIYEEGSNLVKTAQNVRANDPLSVELNATMIDLKLFKLINDVYGHDAGDQILSHVGRVVNESLRKSDRGFRYGGDEILLLYTSQGDVSREVITNRISQGLREDQALNNFLVENRQKTLQKLESMTATEVADMHQKALARESSPLRALTEAILDGKPHTSDDLRQLKQDIANRLPQTQGFRIGHDSAYIPVMDDSQAASFVKELIIKADQKLDQKKPN